MAYPSHYLISLRGALGNPHLEQWSTSFRLSRVRGGSPDYVLTQGHLDDIANDTATLLVQSGHWGSEVTFTEARGYRIGEDGRTVGDVLYSVRPANEQGGGTQAAHPWQCALVLSLRTNIQRGPASRGRMYWPPIRADLDPQTGQISLTKQSQLLESLRSWMQGINNNPGIDGTAARVSVVSGILQGTIADVNRIRVGRAMDTQRRRREDVDEAYIEAGITE